MGGEGRQQGGDGSQADRQAADSDSAHGWVNSGAGRLGASRLGARQKNPAAAAASQAPGQPAPRRGMDADGSMDPHRHRERDSRPPRREMQRDRELRVRKSDPELSEFNRRFSGFFTHAHTKERSRKWRLGASTSDGASAHQRQTCSSLHCSRAVTDNGGPLLPCAGEGVPVGYHRQRFIEAGLMTEDGQKTEYTLRMEVVAANLGLKDSIHIGINVMLTSCTRWDSIMVLVQVPQMPCCRLLRALWYWLPS